LRILIGQGKNIPTVTVPAWIEKTVDAWTAAPGISTGTIFRGASRIDKLKGDGLTPKAIWNVV
jgi:hypothetical protein